MTALDALTAPHPARLSAKDFLLLAYARHGIPELLGPDLVANRIVRMWA